MTDNKTNQEKFAIEQFKHHNKMLEIESNYHKDSLLMKEEAALKEQLMMRKEEIRRSRDFLTYDIFKNSEKLLCREMISENGKSVGSKVICNKKDMTLLHFEIFDDNEPVMYFCVCWEGGTEKDFIYLKETNLDADTLDKKLTKAGVIVQTARDYRKNLLNVLLVYLINNVETVEIPLSHGWCKMSQGWRWIDSETFTKEDLLQYV